MSIPFSSATGGGIVEQVRDLTRTDATQWPTQKIVNSVNNYLDVVTGYAIGADRRFQWDDTNHTKIPIGTTNLVANQSDYSFLTDVDGNPIINLERIDILNSSGLYERLRPISEGEIPYALEEFFKTAGTPIFYDKIADNVVRLYPKPSTSISSALRFFFQRTGSYLTADDTTKSPGVSPLLHRGFVIAAAYDAALALGLDNLQPLSVEMDKERLKMEQYFENRNTDEVQRIMIRHRSSR